MLVSSVCAYDTQHCDDRMRSREPAWIFEAGSGSNDPPGAGRDGIRRNFCSRIKGTLPMISMILLQVAIRAFSLHDWKLAGSIVRHRVSQR
jgi:hypothetical protein